MKAQRGQDSPLARPRSSYKPQGPMDCYSGPKQSEEGMRGLCGGNEARKDIIDGPRRLEN